MRQRERCLLTMAVAIVLTMPSCLATIDESKIQGESSAGGLSGGSGGVAGTGSAIGGAGHAGAGTSGAGGGKAGQGGAGSGGASGSGGTSGHGGSGDVGGQNGGTGGVGAGGQSGEGGGGMSGGSGQGGSGGQAQAGGGQAGAGGEAGATGGGGGGGGGMSGSSGQGGSPPCKAGMVLATAPKTGDDYCIDRDEVTNERYAAFLQNGIGDNASPDCDPALNLTPGTWSASPPPNEPVAGISWCQAYGFCQFDGKRLCGAIATGSADEFFSDAVNPDLDEWVNACEGPSRTTYPYGDTFQSAACDTLGAPGAKLGDVESFPLCVGGASPLLHDMSGSLREWSNSCDTTGTSDKTMQYCHVRGGSWNETNPSKTSRCVENGNEQRGKQYDDVGIRCCSAASH